VKEKWGRVADLPLIYPKSPGSIPSYHHVILDQSDQTIQSILHRKIELQLKLVL
jgi:hypothetical protein